MDKKIIAACPAGLGNRIKCMVSSMRRCRDVVGYSPYVYWPINDECGCAFGDLFSEIGNISELDNVKGQVEINKSWKLVGSKGPVDFKYHSLSKADIEELVPYFMDIEPKEDILDAVESFYNMYRDSFDNKEVIGVHIRKGDFNTLADGRHKISTEDGFVNKIYGLLEVNPNYKFLLCTEDNRTEELFKDIFGCDKIIHFNKRFRDRNDTNGIKEAFVDMLLLSKCPIIIGTFISTFTEVAWWLGACNAKVIIPGAEDKDSVAEVMSKLPQDDEPIYRKAFRKIKIWWSSR